MELSATSATFTGIKLQNNNHVLVESVGVHWKHPRTEQLEWFQLGILAIVHMFVHNSTFIKQELVTLMQEMDLTLQIQLQQK